METIQEAKSLHDLSIPGRLRASIRGSWPVFAAFLVLIGPAIAAPVAGAETRVGAPPWASQITPLARRQGAEIRPVGLFYEVSWSKWLQAGTIQMSFDLPGDKRDPLVRARAKTRSSGAVRAFWPYEGSTRAEVSRTTLYPHRFTHAQSERGERAAYEAVYRNGRMTIESSLTPADGKEAERETRAYDLPQIRDLLSTLLYLQQSALHPGRAIVLLVQPLDRLYLVSFEVAGSEPRTVLGKTWATKRLEIGIRRVTDDFGLAPYTKMRRATIWLSDDENRVPVEIQADLLVGFVSARLASIHRPH